MLIFICEKPCDSQLAVIIEKGLPDTEVQDSVQVETGEPISVKIQRVKRKAKKPRKSTKKKTPNPATPRLSKDFKWRIKKATTRLVLKDYDYSPIPAAMRQLNTIGHDELYKKLKKSKRRLRRKPAAKR